MGGSMESGLRARLEALLGSAITSARPVGGGDIGESWRIDLASGERCFVKRYGPSMLDAARCEARGLEWLGAADALPVARVRACAQDEPLLVLDWIEPAKQRSDFDEALGRGLAALHRSGAASFGLAEGGFIGSLRLPNGPRTRWSDFYAEQRLEPLIRRGREQGLLSTGTTRRASGLLDRLPELCGPQEPPARLHGDLWAGTTRGLWLFRGSSERWSIPRRSTDAEDNVVHALMRASDGRLWVGTRAGLEIRDAEGRIESLHGIGTEPIPVVTTIAEDGEGAIWLGSGSGFEGAWRWKEGRWRHFGAADGLHAPFVHAVRIDSSGRPWFLGLSRQATQGPGPGAFVYEDGRFRPVSPPGGRLARRVYDFAEGPPGSYWLGTHGGLFRLANGQWTSWTAEGLLPTERVFALEMDENNRPWFASGKTGVCHLPDDETVNCEKSSDGLPNDAVWDLEFDVEGALWASTRGGLGVRRDGEWSRILPHHGLPLLRLWPLLVEGDRLLIGTNGRGLVELSLAGAGGPPPRVSFLELDEGQGSTRVEWSADAWWGSQAEGEVENRWRLEGGEWSAWSRRRELLLDAMSDGGPWFAA